MPSFKSINALEKFINQKLSDVLKNEVFEAIREEMQEKVQTVVYDQYDPRDYQRTEKLMRDIEKSMLDENTLIVENTRRDGDKEIVPIIEYGVGYTWGYVRNLDEEIGPRPFVEETRKSLQNSDKLKNAIKNGLRMRGFTVK